MAEKFTIEDINIGGSIFWISLILISLIGLSYLMIWSFHNNSVKGVVVSVIFTTMIITGVLLSRNKIFDMNSWGDNSLSFSIGFFIWSILGTLFTSQSILSVQQNYLFASISSELPIYTETLMNNIIIPISEELFWMIGIPFALLSIMKQMGKKWEFFNNDYLQMAVLIIVCSLTFAIFHVGKIFTYFVIGAIIFRTIMIVMVYGDYKFDFLKGINLVAAFGVGAHIANNFVSESFSKSLSVINQNLVVALIIYIFFGLIFVSAIDRILRFITKKDKDLTGGK